MELREIQKKYLSPQNISKLKNLELKAKFIVEGFITGLHKSPYHGFSVEFSEYKPYNQGEDIKSIDWKVFAKTDKLFSKKYEEETNLRNYILLDVSDSMRYPIQKNSLSKLEYSIYLSAALFYLMLKQKDAISLCLFDENINKFLPPKSLRSHLLRILTELDKELQNQEIFTRKTATEKVLYKLAARIKQRGLIVLISDLFTPRKSAKELLRGLRYLKHQKHELLIFHITDKKTELDFDFPNRPLVLQDLETAEKIKVEPAKIKEEYQKNIKIFFEEIKKQCVNWQIDFIETDLQTPYDKVLFNYLVKRKKINK